jgi:succinate-semialdehyde dehydrogenase/glutarate-semialdehyde dehydrogenase
MNAVKNILILGGESTGKPYYPPTILTQVDESMAVCRDETFGPVLPVMPVQSVDEAIERANASLYGLSAYVFTRNVDRGRAVAEKLQAGTVVVNDAVLTHAIPETPWGGVHKSGLGFTHSAEGLRHLCERRHVNYNRLPAIINPWYFPYQRAMVQPTIALIQAAFGGEGWLRRLRLLVRGGGGFLKLWRQRAKRA